MNSNRYWVLILIGFILLVTGVVLPFLMVIHVIPSTFFLNFFSYTASLVGMILGLIGLAMYVGVHRKKMPKDGPEAGKGAAGPYDGNVRPTNDI